MDWHHTTRQLVAEFQLMGCFLLNRDANEWVGDQPTQAFRDYLEELFEAKEASYFSEIRFFKYKDAHEGEATKVVKYLALVPVDVDDVAFQFLGLIYESQEKLQELLKFRIMPMYLVLWLHRLVAESRLRERRETPEQELLEALEEKRLYARSLEHKVRALNAEIESIRNAEMSLDQKVEELSRLLNEQAEEYQKLATAYQELFDEMQNLQNEYLTTSVSLEQKILDIEVDRRRTKIALRKAERRQGEANSGDHANSVEYKDLAARLRKSQEQAAKYNRLYEDLKQSLNGLAPQQVVRLLRTVSTLKEKLDYYRSKAKTNSAKP